MHILSRSLVAFAMAPCEGATPRQGRGGAWARLRSAQREEADTWRRSDGPGRCIVVGAGDAEGASSGLEACRGGSMLEVLSLQAPRRDGRNWPEWWCGRERPISGWFR